MPMLLLGGKLNLAWVRKPKEPRMCLMHNCKWRNAKAILCFSHSIFIYTLDAKRILEFALLLNVIKGSSSSRGHRTHGFSVDNKPS